VTPATRRWRHACDRAGAWLAVAALVVSPVLAVLLAIGLHLRNLTP
jgi:hypothetical protein